MRPFNRDEEPGRRDDRSGEDGRAWIPRVIAGVVALGVIGAGVWLWPASEADRPERIVQEITLVETPPPPPPPEPEDPIMEEEPEIVEPTDEPQIQEDVEQPTETPSDAPPAPSSLAAGVDRAADAGSDSFRLAAGQGGGLFGRGGGGGGGTWGAYVETHIRRALQRDSRTRSAQGFIRVSVSIDDAGRFGTARLRSSTGDAALDAAIREVLAGLPPLSRSRPAGVQAVTIADINMRRTGG